MTKATNRSVSKYGFRFLGSYSEEYDLTIKRVNKEKPTIHNLSELNHRRMDIGDTVQIDATANNGIDSDSLVYSYKLGGLEISKTGEITAKTTGLSNVTVRDITTGTESTFTVYVDDYSNVFETGTMLEFEKTYTGKIDYSQDYDCFIAEIPTGEAYVVEMPQRQTVMLYQWNKATRKWDFRPSSAVAVGDNYQLSIPKSGEDQIYGIRFLGDVGSTYEFKLKK